MQEMELAEEEIFDDWYKTGVSYQGKNVAGESCEKYSPESIIKPEMLRRHGFSYFCADEQSVINGREMIDAADDVIDKWDLSYKNKDGKMVKYSNEEKKSILHSIWEGESQEGYFAMDVIDPEKYNDVLKKTAEIVGPGNINYSNDDSDFEEMYKNYSIVQ